MSGLGQTLGRWNAHTYQSAAAVISAGLNDGALWILNEGGRPVQAGIWPYEPGPQVHGFETYRDLYQGMGALAAGDFWRIDSPADLAGACCGQIDPTGTDGLRPHPFEGGLYPLNSNTMQLGLIANGDIQQIAALPTGVALTPASVQVSISNGNFGRFRLPVTMHRPAYVALHAQLTQTGGNQNQQSWQLRLLSTLGGAAGSPTEDAHGWQYTHLLAGNQFQCRPLRITNSVAFAQPADFVTNGDGVHEIWNNQPGPATNYQSVVNCRPVNTNNAGEGGPLNMNNGMDLSLAGQDFLFDIIYSVLLGGDDAQFDWYGVEFASQELTA